MNAIELRDVSVRFGDLHALADASTSVNTGEVIMLAGPNGSGKTTLLRVLLGLLRPDSGALYVNGAKAQTDRAFRAQLGYLPESVAFAESLTGRQVLQFFANARRVPSARVEHTLERVGLKSAAHRSTRGYSRGMRQRLGLGIAILDEPTLLILDEPTGGLDQEGINILWGVLEEWTEKGRMVLMSSHDLTLLERRVHRICLLRQGRVLADAPPDVLREETALPICVSFDLRGPSDQLLHELASYPTSIMTGATPERIALSVRPEDLLSILDVGHQFIGTVKKVRVQEPGLDAIYNELLDRPVNGVRP
jgi:Cu-processing system ATP-binding protein